MLINFSINLPLISKRCKDTVPLFGIEYWILEVTLNGFYDNVQATLSSNGQILGTAYGESNFAVILLDEDDVSNLDSMTLTVTGYNIVPVIENVQLGQSCPGYISGDLNGDSLVNIQDIVILVNVVLETITPDNCQLEFGDLNGDGINNILDVIITVNIILDGSL